MKHISMVFTAEEIEKLKNLVKELDSYYYRDHEFSNQVKEWRFEDVDAQREIAVEIANVLRDKF